MPYNHPYPSSTVRFVELFLALSSIRRQSEDIILPNLQTASIRTESVTPRSWCKEMCRCLFTTLLWSQPSRPDIRHQSDSTTLSSRMVLEKEKSQPCSGESAPFSYVLSLGISSNLLSMKKRTEEDEQILTPRGFSFTGLCSSLRFFRAKVRYPWGPLLRM